jgi:predicted phosphodiesterase
MRIAALYDIHGNLPALDAVLLEVEREAPDAIVVGGDLAPGPLVPECLERLQTLDPRCVMGNGDREVVEGVQEHGAGWTADRLTSAQRDALAAFEPVVSLGGALFCHATPRSDTEIVTRLTPEERLAAILDGVSERVVVCGHVHQQYDRVVAGRRVVNAGSVGLPYEGDSAARWAWISGGTPELRRTAYDAAVAGRRMLASGWPDHRSIEGGLIDPVDPMFVTKLFEGVD